ncbi:unnamed protein product [Adineta steineri]|uniref:Uncharacterized protein n=3 Tax=Adineta steineri TaxID=433720 RepID=A0A819R095_9BILA|nr:unnamed protein product [Adineta steineri]
MYDTYDGFFRDRTDIEICFSYHRAFQQHEPWKGEQGMKYRREKAILEKIRLEYFANQYKTTFDMSYSPKLMTKYKFSEPIIQVNRCLTQQQSLEDKSKKQYNLRRFHQLYINIARYDYVHHVTLFNLDFLSVLLLCGEYKITDFLYEFTMMNYDGIGESKFLLKQFEISLNILNQYPNNLSFELVYRLFPFRNHLYELLYKLLEQCLIDCPLLLITDDERPQYLMKCSLSNIIYSKISPFSLFIITDDSKFYRLNNYYRTTVNQFDIIYRKKVRQEKLISGLHDNGYICCLTSNYEMISMNTSKKELTMQIPCNHLTAFIKKEIILIISSSNHSLQIWNCAQNSLLSEYDFHNDIIEDYIFKKSILKVNLKLSQTICYFSIDDNCQIQLIRTIDKHMNNYQHRILLDIYVEFYYSLNSSKASLVIYDDNNPIEIYNDIDFLSLPKSVIYLSNSNSIAWVTDTSVMIFNPLYKEKIFQPFSLIPSADTIQYDLIHDNYSSVAFSGGLGNLLACIIKAKGIVDIYDWYYSKKEQKHVSHHLTHAQLDINIDYCVFDAEHPDGITLYCSDGKHLYKYNATMLSCLIASKNLVSSETILQKPNIHLDQFLTYIDNDQNLEVFTLNDNYKLDFHLSIQSIKEYYFTKNSSHILVINRKNLLSIYSLETSKLLWTTNEFEHRKLQIHSLQSSFILLCPQTKQIFQIDTKLFQIKILIQLPIDCLTTTLISEDRLIILSKDQTNLIEFSLINQTLTMQSSIQLNSSKIIQMYSVYDHLVFHTYDNQIYLWQKDNKGLKQLEETARLITKDNQLVLICTDNKRIILYDLKVKSRQIAHLDDDAGECEVLCLSNTNKNDNEQYLFIICSDRLLRMYRVSNGEQVVKLFINKDLYPFIGILNDHLLLKVENRLCIIKIIDRKSLPSRSSDIKCSLFEKEKWLQCHHFRFP